MQPKGSISALKEDSCQNNAQVRVAFTVSDVHHKIRMEGFVKYNGPRSINGLFLQHYA